MLNAQRPTPLLKPRRAFSLIEILVVMVILVILLMFVGQMLSGKTKDGKGQSPIQKAQGTVCMNNLSQLRQGIQLQKINNENEANPPSLTELKFPAEMLSCPDGKTPYQYDPTTGMVRCTYPFHQKY